VTCAGTYPTAVTSFNPFHPRLDLSRLGIAGHSLGAAGVSAVRGYPGSRFAGSAFDLLTPGRTIYPGAAPAP